MSEESRGNRDIQDAAPHQEKPQRQFRGLYDRVNISVGTLNIVIIVLIALLVACMAYGIAHRGYQIDFDSLGGTAVESRSRCTESFCRSLYLPPGKAMSLTDGIGMRI